MKTWLALITSLFLAFPALAQHDHAHSAGTAATALSEGMVKKVDKATARITIAHGPLENLAMPAMTMAFRVKEAAMLDAVKAGDKIRFVAASEDGSLIVTRLEMAK